MRRQRTTGTNRPCHDLWEGAKIVDMKRVVIVCLWTYSFWYLGALVAAFTGSSDLLGPILGFTAGAAEAAVLRGVSVRRLRLSHA